MEQHHASFARASHGKDCSAAVHEALLNDSTDERHVDGDDFFRIFRVFFAFMRPASGQGEIAYGRISTGERITCFAQALGILGPEGVCVLFLKYSDERINFLGARHGTISVVAAVPRWKPSQTSAESSV